MTQPPKDYPITGVCVVADPAKCPPGYDLIFYSHDKRDDCDLWKDSFFKAKVTRYLCITRVFPLDAGRLNNVLADIVIQTEKDIPPSGFTLLEKTLDTCERATSKKQVCVRMLPRDTTQNAISDLIILSKTKRAPKDYTLAGEINGLLLCFKLGEVPPDTRNKTSGDGLTKQNTIELTQSYFTNTQSAPETVAPKPATVPPPVPPRLLDNHQTNSPVSNSAPSPSPPKHPLSGVPFHLSPAFQNLEDFKTGHMQEMPYRSQVDINNEYSYPFRLERSAAVRVLGDL